MRVGGGSRLDELAAAAAKQQRHGATVQGAQLLRRQVLTAAAVAAVAGTQAKQTYTLRLMVKVHAEKGWDN